MLHRMILLLTCVVDTYLVYDFCENILPVRERFRGKKKLLLAIAAVLILFSINLLENTYVNLAGAFIVYLLYVGILFEARLMEKVFYVGLMEIIILAGEVFLTILLEIPPKLMRVKAITDLEEISWQIFTAKLMSYMLVTILKQVSHKGKHHMPIKVLLLYLVQPFASVVIMMLSYYANANSVVTAEFKIALTFGFAFMVLGNILMFYAFNRYAEQTAIAAEQQTVIVRQQADESHYAQIAEKDERYRELMHDMLHYLRLIGSLIREKKDEKAISVVQEITGEIEQARGLVICQHPILDMLLREKKQEGEKRGIHMDISVEPGVHTEGVSDKDLMSMAGNLLDNAIRAADESKERYVRVRIYMQGKGNFFVVEMTNPYEGGLLPSREGFLSTKSSEGEHGIGLKSVKRMAERYHGHLEYEAENHIFTVILMLQVNNAI